MNNVFKLNASGCVFHTGGNMNLKASGTYYDMVLADQ